MHTIVSFSFVHAKNFKQKAEKQKKLGVCSERWILLEIK